MKNKKMIIALLIMMSLISSTIILNNAATVKGGMAKDAGREWRRGPVLQVSITKNFANMGEAAAASNVAYIDRDPVDTWLYVSNPSQSLDRLMLLPDPPYTTILHTVTINYLEITLIDTDGTEYFWRFEPPEEEPQDWDDYRWDAVVNPRETSLVFYVGFAWTSDEGSVPGLAHFTYLLNCEFDEVEYNLGHSFTVVVRP
jgi:hypothetical protein